VASGIEDGEATDIRVIVSFERAFHAYQETLAAAIRILRPDAEVITVKPHKIGGAAERFGPDVVIGSTFDEADVEGVPVWVELSPDPSRASRIRMYGDYSEMVNPTLDKLLVILEEAAREN
jgi:hypothetical protein